MSDTHGTRCHCPRCTFVGPRPPRELLKADFLAQEMENNDLLFMVCVLAQIYGMPTTKAGDVEQ